MESLKKEEDSWLPLKLAKGNIKSLSEFFPKPRKEKGRFK